MQYDQHSILKHLDSPTRLLTMKLQDIVAYILPVIFASLVDSMLIVSCVGIGIVFIARKYLARFPRFYFIRLLYWYIPTEKYNKRFKTKLPPSNIQLWLRR